MIEPLVLSWGDVHVAATILAQRLRVSGKLTFGRGGIVVAEPRGGLVLGVLLAHRLSVGDQTWTVHTPATVRRVIDDRPMVWCDDLIDTGATWALAGRSFLRVKDGAAVLATKLGDKHPSEVEAIYRVDRDRWVRFPWEVATEDARNEADYQAR